MALKRLRVLKRDPIAMRKRDLNDPSLGPLYHKLRVRYALTSLWSGHGGQVQEFDTTSALYLLKFRKSLTRNVQEDNC